MSDNHRVCVANEFAAVLDNGSRSQPALITGRAPLQIGYPLGRRRPAESVELISLSHMRP